MTSFPKPERYGPKPKRPIARRTRVRRMSDKFRELVEQRKNVTRPAVLIADHWGCRACDRRYPNGAASPSQPGWWLEVNEHPPRSLGGDFNDPTDCLVLCSTWNGDGCHQRYTAKKLKIAIIDSERKCRAPVTFTEGDRIWTG